MPTEVLQRYRGALFDSAHWTRMQLRPGDVVVSTPPKCGTTWTLAMIYLLLNGGDAEFDSLSNVAPWIDHRGAEAAPKGPGRRLFKSHTPLDGIPIVDGVSYITVFRSPGAAFLSMRRHLENMRDPIPNHPNAGPWPVALERFLNAPLQLDRFGGVTLSAVKHYLDCADSSATLMLHYADMVDDQTGVLTLLQRHLGLALTHEELRKITSRTSRRHMASKARDFVPEGERQLFKDSERFFTSSRLSTEHFRNEELAKLAIRTRSLIGNQRSNWISRGSKYR